MTLRTKLGFVIFVLALLVGSVALGVWMSRDRVVAQIDSDMKQAVRNADPAAIRTAAPIYYTFDPPLIVNLEGSEAVLQAGLALSTHHPGLAGTLKSEDPALRSAILLAIGDADPSLLASDRGKARLLSSIVAAVNRQLQQDDYPGEVEAAYFTSFVIQGDDDEP